MITRLSPSTWAPGGPGSAPSPDPDFVAHLDETPQPAPFRLAKFGIGQVVKHRVFNFRGVIFDVDPVFANTEEWWQAIPAEVRPHKDQPFYHLLAENSETEYVAYVSEQNLLPDDSGEPIRHSQVAEIFVKDKAGGYRPRNSSLN